MQVTSITEFRTRPGRYLEWPVSLGPGEASDIAPSFNQQFHLGSALDDAASTAVWIATAFDVVGPIDVDAATWAFETFVARHAALRTTFHRAGDDIRRRVHPVDDIRVGAPHTVDVDDAAAHFRARMNQLCHPARTPSYSFAAVSRTDRSTILCGFDHAHVDAVSMTVAADEVSALYEARRTGRAADLAATGSFVDYCELESAEPEVPASDPRVLEWADFVRRCGQTTPSFPIDLGVGSDAPAPQATTVHSLASARVTDAFEERCRDLGVGMFSGVTAALAEAVSGTGGPHTLRFLFPLHTRHDQLLSRAVGWFTTNAPMSVSVGNDFAETCASAHASFRAALPLATVSVPRVLAALGDRFRRTRQDVFMISYVDYRTLPGADAPHRRAHHISNVTSADDAQFWISRTHDGLSLRSRFPDTDAARGVVDAVARRLTALVRTDEAAEPEVRALALAGPSAG